MHLATNELLVNLVMALIFGLLGAVLVVRLKQSVILGYILAGIAIGPFTPGFVGDSVTVTALADLGIIFLMFAIGAHISFGDLMRVGRIALVGGIAQVLATIGIGYAVGIALGWSSLEAFFFGAVVSISSSIVLSKALDQRGEIDSEHGRIALGWSSMQDFATIILVVVLTALAQGNGNLFTELPVALGKTALFLVVVIPLGSKAIPWLFERLAVLGNREIFIVTVTATALGTAYAASLFGISLALGAFIAGVVVAESDLSHQILGEVTPLRDIFSGLFFVSVGMLVDLAFVIQNLPLVILTIVIIVVVKGLLSAGLTFFFGYPIRTAILTGIALASSAEFSFILARLGLDLGAISASTFSLLLAAATASIVLAPNLFPIANPIIVWLERHLPISKLAAPAEDASGQQRLRNHIVICGFGRIGQIVSAAARRRGFSFVVIDEDPREVRKLRAEGITALLGSAANPILLENANVPQAKVMVVVMPDPITSRQIVDYAKKANPSLNIVVRVQSEKERDYMLKLGVAEAVMSETEVGIEMTRHTLRKIGVSALETQAIVHGIRQRLTEEDAS